MNWTKTSEQLPKLYAPVLTNHMIEARLTPDGWRGDEGPDEWAYIYKPQRKEDQTSISEWGAYTFGTAKDPAILVGRALEEFAELVSLLVAPKIGQQFTELVKSLVEEMESPSSINQEILDEMADVLVVLYQASEGYGVDLLGAVDAKMKINRERKWKVSQSGIGQHQS